MSTIVSPYPPLNLDDQRPDPAAQWWRLDLRPNADGNLVIERCGPVTDDEWDPKKTEWISWEFFDGCDTFLDAGLDKPTVNGMRLSYRHRTCPVTGLLESVHGSLDILCAEPPTPSPYWCPMTPPGDFSYPESYSEHYSNGPECTPSRSRLRGGRTSPFARG